MANAMPTPWEVVEALFATPSGSESQPGGDAVTMAAADTHVGSSASNLPLEGLERFGQRRRQAALWPWRQWARTAATPPLTLYYQT